MDDSDVQAARRLVEQSRDEASAVASTLVADVVASIPNWARDSVAKMAEAQPEVTARLTPKEIGDLKRRIDSSLGASANEANRILSGADWPHNAEDRDGLRPIEARRSLPELIDSALEATMTQLATQMEGAGFIARDNRSGAPHPRFSYPGRARHQQRIDEYVEALHQLVVADRQLEDVLTSTAQSRARQAWESAP